MALVDVFGSLRRSRSTLGSGIIQGGKAGRKGERQGKRIFFDTDFSHCVRMWVGFCVE